MINSLPLIVGIVLWGYVLTSILKIKEGFGPVLGIAVSMAVLEIGGAFGILWPVANLYCIIVCILSVAYIARTRDIADMKAYFLNPSIIGFLFAALLYLILSSGRTLFYTADDSFLHWGMFSKNVFYSHNLDVWNKELSVNHNVYPHGMAAWYSLFALGKRTYAERDVLVSINILLFAASCPIVDTAVCRIRKLLPSKKIYSVIVYLLSGISVASLLWIWRFGKDVWSYTSGYMDIPLGAAFMAALCLAVTESADYYRKAFGVSLLSAMPVMIKPSGIIFVSVVCLVYLINEYISKGFQITSNSVRKLLGAGMLAVSVPLIELGIWNAMMKYLGITGGDQFRLKSFLPSNVIAKYQSDTAYVELFHTVIHNFFRAFLTREMVLHISAFWWMVICIAIAVFTILFMKDLCGKRKVLCVNACMLLCFCLYNLFLLWTYLTTMSKGEATGINCYDRYIGTYVIGWLTLCIYFLFSYHVRTWKVECLYFGAFFLFNILGFLDRSTYLREIDPEIGEVYELSEDIKECIFGIDDDSEEMPDLWLSYAERKESLIGSQSDQLKYYLFPDFDLINIYGIQENYQREMKDIVNEFSFDYVVFYGVNEDFYNSYYWFFADGLSNAREKYENGHYQAYKVIRDESTNEFCWFEPIL